MGWCVRGIRIDQAGKRQMMMVMMMSKGRRVERKVQGEGWVDESRIYVKK